MIYHSSLFYPFKLAYC